MEDVMGALFTVAHIAQLHEIQAARLKRNKPGIGHEVEELIRRLTSGGVSVKTDDLRVVQAKRLWDMGFGRELDLESFDVYLASIPEIPKKLVAHDERFPELILVDARLDIRSIYPLLGVENGGDAFFDSEYDGRFVDLETKGARTKKVYWIRMQDGKESNRGSPLAHREVFPADEIGLNVHEGLAFAAQYPKALRGWTMYLAASVYQQRHSEVAYLACNWNGIGLRINRGCDTNIGVNSGTASRRV